MVEAKLETFPFIILTYKIDNMSEEYDKHACHEGGGTIGGLKQRMNSFYVQCASCEYIIMIMQWKCKIVRMELKIHPNQTWDISPKTFWA